MIKLFKLNYLRNSLNLNLIYKINVKFLVTLICLTFLGVSIYNNAEALSNETIGFQEISWIFAAIISSLLSIVINAYAWMFLVKSLGYKTNNLSLINIFVYLNQHLLSFNLNT